MEARLILRFVGDKLLDPATYILALVVGSIINLYGQFLLPWFRGSFDPPTDFLIEYEIRPDITIFSVLLGFAFPFCVGLYSAVAARYKSRRIEAISSLPERSPDPMFRADQAGRVIEAGANSWQFLKTYGIDDASKILGDDLWARIVSGVPLEDRPTIYFEPSQASYVVAHTQADDGAFNIYLSRLPQRFETGGG